MPSLSFVLNQLVGGRQNNVLYRSSWFNKGQSRGMSKKSELEWRKAKCVSFSIGSNTDII